MPVILYSGYLQMVATGPGFRTVASVTIEAGLLLEGVLRYSISGRRTLGAGTTDFRMRIGGVDLIAPGSGDSSANLYIRGCAAAITPTNYRANAMHSRNAPNQVTGLAVVNLADELDLTFLVNLSNDADEYSFDELLVEHWPPTQ